MKKYIATPFLISSFLLLSVQKVLAQEGIGGAIGEVLCNNNSGIDTAIGCIPIFDGTTPFIIFLIRWALGIGGGVAFLLIVYAGFLIMTSQGNPERMKAGQELLTSALAGLFLIIFSVVILEIVGMGILGIQLDKP